MPFLQKLTKTNSKILSPVKLLALMVVGYTSESTIFPQVKVRLQKTVAGKIWLEIWRLNFTVGFCKKAMTTYRHWR